MYLDVMQYVAPHAPGFCILVRREVHEAIGGFDETVVLAEDHDYVQRAAEQRHASACSATARCARRCGASRRKGLVRLAFKYLYCELYVVTGRPIREVPFDYEFAAFEPAAEKGGHPAIEALRTQIGGWRTRVFSAVCGGRRVAASSSARLMCRRPRSIAALRDLAGADIKRIERYVGARVRLARRGRRHAISGLREFGAAVWRGIGGAGG